MPINWGPLQELDRVAQALGQLLNRPAPLRVDRSDDEVRLDVDLPGVKADDIELTVDAERVVVRAVRRSGPVGSASEVHREYRVDEPVDLDRVSADHEDGVLTVHLPRAAGSQARRVPVRSGGEHAPTPPSPGGAAPAPTEGAAANPAGTASPPPGEQANPLPTS